MTERDFVYWLQGFLEVSQASTMNEQQVQIVKDHLALVLTKVTPTYATKAPTVFSTSRTSPAPAEPPTNIFDRNLPTEPVGRVFFSASHTEAQSQDKLFGVIPINTIVSC